MALNAPPQPRPARLPPGRRLLDNLWFAAGAAQVTMALTVLLAFTFALAALIPQLPAGSDPAAAARWLSTTAAGSGRFGPFVASAGLLNLLDGPWIAGLLAVTAFHLAVRTARQAHGLARRHDVRLAPQGLPFGLIHRPVPPAALQPRIAALAQTHPRHTLHDESGPSESAPAQERPRVDAFLERGAWAQVGPLLTYLGPLLIAGGLLWNSLEGWRVLDLILAPGRVAQPPEARGFALNLVSADGATGEQPGVISMAQGRQTRDAWLAAGRPANWGNVWIAQRSSGPALTVTAQLDGRRLPLQALEAGEGAAETLRLRFGQNENEQGFAIPAANLAFRVVSYASLPERGIDRPVFLLEGFRVGEAVPQLDELIEDERSIQWQGVNLSLRRDRYVVVDLASVPGLPLLLLGGLTFLVGAAVIAWGGLTRTWINAAAEGDGLLLAVRSAAPAAGQREVAAVLKDLAADGRLTRPRRLWWLLFGGRAWAVVTLLAGLAAAALMVAPLLGRAAGPLDGLLIARHALAGLGIGAWLPALALSVRWAATADAPEPVVPGPMLVMQGRTGDPGRGPALVAFPLLVASAIAGAAWDLLALAVPLRGVAGEMWLLSALCLAMAYFHATSGWRPLRAPSWLTVLLASATAGAGVALLLTAPSLLMGVTR